MAKGHRSQIKRARNESNRETRPSAKLSYARISVQKACYVLDAIRGKDVQTALGILTYNPRYASSVIKKLLESAIANAENNNGMNADNLVVAAFSVSSVGSGCNELTEFVANHILCYIYRHVFSSVMDSDCVSYEGREDCRTA